MNKKTNNLIGITGYKGAGKTQVAELLNQKLSESHTVIASAHLHESEIWNKCKKIYVVAPWQRLKPEERDAVNYNNCKPDIVITNYNDGTLKNEINKAVSQIRAAESSDKVYDADLYSRVW